MFLSINAQDIWKTEFEKSGYKSTANYDESIKYFEMLAENSEYAKLESFGISPQGRTLYVLIVDKNKNFNPVEISERKKPVILIQNGIHSGEIEGKDASKLLLREILITKEKNC